MLEMQQQAHEAAKEITDNNTDLINGCCLMGFDISSSCGEVTLPEATIEIDGQKVSSSHVNGSKLQWFPRKHLTITSKYTGRLNREFNKVGIRHGDWIVVPKTKVDDLQRSLEAHYQDWEADLNALLGDFDSILAKHKQDNPDIAALVSKYAYDKDKFKTRFTLRYRRPLAIQPLYESDIPELEKDIAKGLWEQIVEDAMSLYKSSWFKNKVPVSRVSQKIREPLKRICSKLMSLSFLDESVVGVVRSIEDVMSKLPTRGYIEGHAFEQLTKCIHVISDAEKLKLHATGTQPFYYEPAVSTAPAANVETSAPTTESSSLPAPSVRPTPQPVQPIPPQQMGFGTSW